MPQWLAILMTAAVGAQVALVAWVAKKFDTRLSSVEVALVDLKLILDRGQRHEAAIARLQEQHVDLALEVARWRAH